MRESMLISCYQLCLCMDYSVYAPSQWEMVLPCNNVSHWLDAYTEWSLPLLTSCGHIEIFPIVLKLLSLMKYCPEGVKCDNFPPNLYREYTAISARPWFIFYKISIQRTVYTGSNLCGSFTKGLPQLDAIAHDHYYLSTLLIKVQPPPHVFVKTYNSLFRLTRIPSFINHQASF